MLPAFISIYNHGFRIFDSIVVRISLAHLEGIVLWMLITFEDVSVAGFNESIQPTWLLFDHFDFSLFTSTYEYLRVFLIPVCNLLLKSDSDILANVLSGFLFSWRNMIRICPFRRSESKIWNSKKKMILLNFDWTGLNRTEKMRSKSFRTFKTVIITKIKWYWIYIRAILAPFLFYKNKWKTLSIHVAFFIARANDFITSNIHDNLWHQHMESKWNSCLMAYQFSRFRRFSFQIKLYLRWHHLTIWARGLWWYVFILTLILTVDIGWIFVSLKLPTTLLST